MASCNSIAWHGGGLRNRLATGKRREVESAERNCILRTHKNINSIGRNAYNLELKIIFIFCFFKNEITWYLFIYRTLVIS